MDEFSEQNIISMSTKFRNGKGYQQKQSAWMELQLQPSGVQEVQQLGLGYCSGVETMARTAWIREFLRGFFGYQWLISKISPWWQGETGLGGGLEGRDNKSMVGVVTILGERQEKVEEEMRQ